jgi:hypothetical protein
MRTLQSIAHWIRGTRWQKQVEIADLRPFCCYNANQCHQLDSTKEKCSAAPPCSLVAWRHCTLLDVGKSWFSLVITLHLARGSAKTHPSEVPLGLGQDQQHYPGIKLDNRRRNTKLPAQQSGVCQVLKRLNGNGHSNRSGALKRIRQPLKECP